MIPDQAAIDLLKDLMNRPALDARIRLAKNNPVASDAALVIGNLVEADFNGYGSVLCNTLPAPTTNVSGEAESDSPTLVWTAGGGLAAPQTCYLMYVTFIDYTGNLKLWAVGRFSQPATVTLPGDTIQKKFNFYAWNGIP